MISESGLWWFVRIATIIPKREHKEILNIREFDINFKKKNHDPE